MSNERSNRTRKAEAIAAVLVTVKVTAEHAASMDDLVWQLAARTGAALINEAEGTTSDWTDASPATRTEVIALLAADEAKAANELVAHETDDVFARIAAPHTGPQDPDAPIPTATTPAPRPVHFKTDSSHVACGAIMRHWRDNPTGWDLGNTTVNPGAVTCPECRGFGPSPRDAAVAEVATWSQVSAVVAHGMGIRSPWVDAIVARKPGEYGREGVTPEAVRGRQLGGSNPATAAWLAAHNYGAPVTESWD